jgi:hypothetical protein
MGPLCADVMPRERCERGARPESETEPFSKISFGREDDAEEEGMLGLGCCSPVLGRSRTRGSSVAREASSERWAVRDGGVGCDDSDENCES